MTEIYRLRTVVGTSSVSSGEFRYFEDVIRFEEAVLNALIEAEVFGVKEAGSLREARGCRTWRRKATPEADDTGMRIRRVVAAERLVCGEWLDLKASLIPPLVEFEEDLT